MPKPFQIAVLTMSSLAPTAKTRRGPSMNQVGRYGSAVTISNATVKKAIQVRPTRLHGRTLGRDVREAYDVTEEDRHVVEQLGAHVLRQLQLQCDRLGQHLVEQRVRLLLLATQLLQGSRYVY